MHGMLGKRRAYRNTSEGMGNSASAEHPSWTHRALTLVIRQSALIIRATPDQIQKPDSYFSGSCSHRV